MTHLIRKPFLLLAAILALCALPGQAQQSPFSTAFMVNDEAITQYEIDQRILFLQLLRVPGNPQEAAREGLIEDRLRLAATRAAGIAVNDQEVLEGMDEFAGRANLSREQFMAAIAERGVAAETFRDFVASGLAWRQLVRNRFGPRAQVTEAEVDSALSLSSSQADARVLLSEIIVPLTPENEAEARGLIQRLSEQLTTVGAFASAARQYSAAPTRDRGGRLDWLPLGRIPPQLRAQVLTLGPGQVSEPIDLGPGIGIFQLRALEESDFVEAETLALEYVQILLPSGSAQATAESYDDNYDTCDDLYKPAQTMSEGQFERVVLPAAEVPNDIAVELAKLDDHESSFALTRQNGAFTVYLKLCGRTLETPAGEDGEEIDQRTQMREQLFQQRLASYADSFLEELRADAIIVEQ